jgi:hypothetical protein
MRIPGLWDIFLMKVWNKSKPHPKTAVFIGRPTKYGNPFPITSTQNREEVILKYADYLSKNPDLVNVFKKELEGKDLVCFCSPLPCHGDVIKFLWEKMKIKFKGSLVNIDGCLIFGR